MKILVYTLALFAEIIAVLLFVVRNLRNEMKLTKAQLAASEKARDEYAKQVQRLTSAGEITAENRRESDEKVDSLHSGDAVGNALDELSKHKN